MPVGKIGKKDRWEFWGRFSCGSTPQLPGCEPGLPGPTAAWAAPSMWERETKNKNKKALLVAKSANGAFVHCGVTLPRLICAAGAGKMRQATQVGSTRIITPSLGLTSNSREISSNDKSAQKYNNKNFGASWNFQPSQFDDVSNGSLYQIQQKHICKASSPQDNSLCASRNNTRSLSPPGRGVCSEVWQTCNFEVIEMTGLLAVVRARKRVRGAANESVSWVAPACQPASRTQET